MICIELDNTKEFMTHLFIKETFDRFLCQQINIDTFVSFRIDGGLLKDFLTDEEQENLAESSLVPWSMLKPRCFGIIKGSRTPLSIFAVFYLSKQEIEKFANENGLTSFLGLISGLCINIKFTNSKLNITTGTSLNTFTMDKSVEQAWDNYVKGFIAKTEV